MNKYGSDFKVKGKTLIAYTGSSQFMVVPEGIERIITAIIWTKTLWF